MDLEAELRRCATLIDAFESIRQLNRPEDAGGAFVAIRPGAGLAPESFAWVGLLARLYQRWAERQAVSATMIEGLPHETAGFKFVVLHLKGEFVFGRLDGEIGTHRLVRYSPFDPEGRRHTTFALVDVLPDFDGNLGPPLVPEDLLRQTFRTGWMPGSAHT